MESYGFDFTPDGRLVYQTLEAGRLTDSDEKHLYWYGYAPDGKTLVVTRGELSRDAVLVENFLPNP